MSNFCQTCGGQVARVDNYYVCEYCGNKWEIDSANDVHAVERANAWAALRDGDFEKAGELFDNILLKDSKNHEGYWGRALAHAGIVYVTDMSENKKVPTCNNITEASFLQSKDVQKAVSLAPEDIAEGYKAQAAYIENVRLEWLEKASKEPAYDVFISFKDSDRENGIERTQDSIDAQDLYNALVAEGYKVFFSRISLRDKIAEQYEPYIYNAIKTAKVMIVFGEKPEYFSSVWIKNEWTRFRARIEKGEKHKNSLVVVYKNMNPGDLPVVLKSRQCMNMADMTFLSDLTKHIRRVVEEAKRNVHLEKITLATGQVAKKASTLSVNAVQTRQIGEGAIAETSISEKQSISLIRMYLEEKQWHEAASLADDVLFNNPTCAEVVWCSMLARHHASTNEEFGKKLNNLRSEDYGAVEKTLNCSSKTFAENILRLLYKAEPDTRDERYEKLMTVILPFAFNGREECIRNAMSGVIENSKYASFQLLLKALAPDQVDDYISYNYRYALTTGTVPHRNQCLNRILEVDAGNTNALRVQLITTLQTDKALPDVIRALETLLQYAASPGGEVKATLDWLSQNLQTKQHCEFAKELLRYYTGNIAELKDALVALSYAMLEKRFFQETEFFWNLVVSFAPDCPDAYWGICLMKIEAASEKDVPEKKKLLRDLPEFNKYLTFVDDKRRRQCIELSKKQIAAYIEARRKLVDERRELDRETAQSNSGCFSASLVGGLIFLPAGVGLFAADMTFLGTIVVMVGILCVIGFVGAAKGLKEKRKLRQENLEKIKKIDKLLEDMPEIQQ